MVSVLFATLVDLLPVLIDDGNRLKSSLLLEVDRLFVHVSVSLRHCDAISLTIPVDAVVEIGWEANLNRPRQFLAQFFWVFGEPLDDKGDVGNKLHHREGDLEALRDLDPEDVLAERASIELLLEQVYVDPDGFLGALV